MQLIRLDSSVQQLSENWKLSFKSTQCVNIVAMSDLCPVAVSKAAPNAFEDQPQTWQEANSLLLKEKEYCDVTFTFPNLPDRIEAHELFLKARSPVFKQMFRKRKSGDDQGRKIEISESTPGRFQEFLEFIYMDKFEVNMAGALDLLPLAQKYKVQPLMKKCEELIETEMDADDSVQVFETARRHGRDELVDQAGEIMIKSLSYLFEIDALKDAEEETVMYILERDDLTVKEADLFEFIVKWGKGQVTPSDGAQLLQDKLKNFIPLIRFADMTPYEFTKVVSPSGLLSGEEMLSVYTYITGDEAMRKDMKVKFNTTRRKVEACVDFYAGNEDGYPRAESSSCPLRKSMSFQVETCEELWQALKKPSIIGIKLKWPYRSVTYSSIADTTLNFSVFIKECYGPHEDPNVGLPFQKFLLNCKNGDEDEILVEPPVELLPGGTYCITVEDQSRHRQKPSHHIDMVNYTYSGEFSPYGLSPEASVDLGGFDLKLKGIKKENLISGKNHFTQSYHNINVIRGIKISLV